MRSVASQDIWNLVYRTARRAGFVSAVAEIFADSTTDAELRGKSSVGLDHLFYYFQAAAKHLINVAPSISQASVTPSMITVDADHGPMQFAYRQAEAALLEAAQTSGIAVLLIKNAFAGGELGYYARRLAQRDILSISMANSPAVMSVGGSYDRLVGTNPLSYGVPLADDRAIVIDQASSSTARVNFQKYANQGQPIHEDWALDKHGQPTTQAAEALAGTLLPFGGYKGGNITLLVEFIAMLGGGDSSYEAAPYIDGTRQQGIGASIIAIDTGKMPGYTARIDELLHSFTRDHGSKIRVTKLTDVPQSVEVSRRLWTQLEHYAENGSLDQTE
ncbi:Ldh family oxidoreductase [Yaniella halotolerans]|uniref:Ldh family oxidoreductase n=1 Tax=Yaniella halotolerans TaxID=225453 RepID=UPI0003B363D4|nr:Ldh family oxidoreductase [Yaniella halotolerans]